MQWGEHELSKSKPDGLYAKLGWKMERAYFHSAVTLLSLYSVNPKNVWQFNQVKELKHLTCYDAKLVLVQNPADDSNYEAHISSGRYLWVDEEHSQVINATTPTDNDLDSWKNLRGQWKKKQEVATIDIFNPKLINTFNTTQLIKLLVNKK